jgi:hypothetical protein
MDVGWYSENEKKRFWVVVGVNTGIRRMGRKKFWLVEEEERGRKGEE